MQLPAARSLIAGVLVPASLMLAACGGSQSPTMLNTEKVERAIEHSSLAQRGAHARASCPSGIQQKKGSTFSCTAVAKGVSTRFAVTQIDGAGRVRYEGR